MMESRRIDHIVLAVNDLDAVAARYETLGFTLTPRAQHEDHMGTSNRLVQFEGRNFIELLEVDRPETLTPHDFAASPPHFSFGAQNRDFVTRGNGISTLVLTGNDSQADIEEFRAAGLQTYAPFDFQRLATLPDGEQVTVAFSLAFATSPDMPGIAFFTCHHKAPQYFWKPAFQKHANGGARIAAAYIAAAEPGRHRDFFSGLTRAQAEEVSGGLRFQCGQDALLVLSPTQLNRMFPQAGIELGDGPRIAGFTIETGHTPPAPVSAQDGFGAFIDWRQV